ncbi:MAG: glycosyl hydrolase [Bacteroidota bacterium]
MAKFEPPLGKCILFVGQELEAIGGLAAPYNDGYFDHFPKPGGFTMYTGFSPGEESFGYTMKGLDGVWTTDDWGDSNNNMSLQLADEDFKALPLAIGLWMTGGHEKKVADGTHDQMVGQFGQWLKSLSPRPIFLRIGYEFHGPWNNYDRESYLQAYRRIKDRYDQMGLDNVAYVWQSHGFDEPDSLLQAWYPGDDYVDWCGYSFFARWQDSNMINFARQKGKPVFIAEATPTIGSPTVRENGKTIETILSNPQQAEQAWKEWFVPFFQTIRENEDVVKAVSYINCNWKSHPMWLDNPHFQEVDARLQTSDIVRQKWLEKIGAERFNVRIQ